MKSQTRLHVVCKVSRAPQGARGLKSYIWLPIYSSPPVAPRKGRVG